MKFFRGWFFEFRCYGIHFGRFGITIIPLDWYFGKSQGYGRFGKIKVYRFGPFMFEIREFRHEKT